MSVNSIRHFSKRMIRKAGRLDRRRGIPCYCVGAQESRHVRWALAITERSARRVPRYATHPEKMTLSLAKRFWILLRQIAARCRYPAIPVISLQTRESLDRPASQSTCTRERKLHLIDPQAGERFIRAISPTSSVWPASCVHNLTKPTLSERIHVIERTERFSIRQPLLTPSRERIFAPPVADFFAHRAIRPPQSHASESSPEIADIPTQVQKRHRRLEQRLFLRPPDGADQFPSTLVPPAVFEKLTPRASARAAIESPFEPKPQSRISPSQPPVNIGLITDAVLQQLDRRLVAARERMGRI